MALRKKEPEPIDPLVALQPQNFVNGGFTLQFYLPYVIITNADSVAHVITFQLKAVGSAPQLSMSVTLAVGETEPYPVTPFQSVSIDTATANVVAFYSAEEIASYPTVKLQGNQTFLGTQAGGANLASPTAYGVFASPGGTVPIGTLFNWTLGCTGEITTAGTIAGAFLVGSISNRMYGFALAPVTITGSFYLAKTENVDLYVQNSDSVAHYIQYAYTATTP